MNRRETIVLSEPVPPPSPGQESGSNKWPFGCLAGCGVAILLGAVVAVGVAISLFLHVQANIDTMRVEVAATLNEEYGRLKEQGKVPADDAPLFDDLVAVTQQNDAGFYIVALSMDIVTTSLQDGEVTEAERTNATDLRDFAHANPGAGLMKVSTFAESHPGLQDALHYALSYTK